MAAAVLAIIAANSIFAASYFEWLATPVSVAFGGFSIDKSLLLWINDALMALFFFLIGLEVKREIVGGQLSTWKQAALPVYAAIGGIVLPALIYVAINFNNPENLSGWAIPAATDIAFALGLLALLGNRVPVALKALLLAVAIIDDIAAIAVIAVFYTDNLATGPLLWAILPLTGMIALNRFGISRTWPYAVLGVILWVLVLKSGVHATLAGVAAAFTIPIAVNGEYPLERLEHSLHPWIAFAVLPLFAFANAGISLTDIGLGDLFTPLPLGIAAGLIFGKQLGIFGFCFLAIRSGLADLPLGTGWAQLYGLACLAGIGFTMSLFIGGLAFDDPAQISAVKLGVLSGSLISAVSGLAVLAMTGKPAVARLAI